LRISADRAKRVKDIFRADARRSADYGVRLDHRAVSKFDAFSDHGKRAYAHTVPNTSTR
jgi:hypothetical protein